MLNHWFIDDQISEIKWGFFTEDSEFLSPGAQYFEDEEDFATALQAYPDEYAAYLASKEVEENL